MNLQLLFWAASLVNLAVLCGVALFGVRYARRGEIARHRHAMKISSWLVVAFLGAYLLKVGVIGREDQSVWSNLDVWVLRIHELFVLFMIGGGAVAWIQGRKLALTQIVTHDPSDPTPDAKIVLTHRVAGRAAVISSVFALVLAIGIFAGMVARG